MRTINYLMIILMAGVFALAGCGKSAKAPTPGAAGIDVAKLQAAFPSPGPQAQNSLDKVKFLTSQSRFEPALSELAVMAKFPNLTPEQKQAIDDVTEQVKKALAAAPAKPAQ
jgi:hypothetical protein